MKPILPLIACAFLLATTQSARAAKPNILILFSDDQGTLDVNCFGSKDLHTPNMDRLAKEGTRFTQAYAHAVCCPARAALLTARHPQRGDVNSWMQSDMHADSGLNMALSEITIAEVLKGQGYDTALFGKWHLGAHKNHGPMRQGFDQFFGIRDGFIDNYNHFYLHRQGFHDLYEGTKEVFAKGKYFPKLMVDRALQFLDDKRRQEKPFFLYVPFNIPHYPEQALKEHADRYRNLAEPRRSYAAMISSTDAFIGQILDKLDERKLTKNTIVLFLSDNGHSEESYTIRIDGHRSGYSKGHRYGAGGGGGNTGSWIGRKGTFLEGGIRTPAILRYPDHVPAGAVRGQIVTAMDWFPTMFELGGLQLPKHQLDGHSAVPVIKSNDAPSAHKVLHFQWQEKWCVREGDWKLTHMKPTKANPSGLSLHSLSDEKPEVNDYRKQKPEVVKRLQKLHEGFVKDVFGAGGVKVIRDPKRKLNL